MATPLSPKDIDLLLANPSVGVRAELAEKVATKFAGTGLTPGEISLAQDIVRILTRDVAISVRAAVSHGLRTSPYLPHDVAQRLADDIDVVALPLLSESLVLTDADLIDLVGRTSDTKQVAIATRANLAGSVSDALLTQSGERAVAALMRNNTATIAVQSLNQAVTRFSASDPVMKAMVLRHNLPITVAERLVTLVSSELQRHLVDVHALPPGIASDIVLQSREQAIIRLGLGSSEAELVQMITRMHNSARLTPTLILRSLCTGDIAFFEAAMAIKGNVPITNAQILIHDVSRRGLAALYRKAEMPPKLFDAVRAAVDVVAEAGFDGDARDLERFRARIISRILTVTESMDPSDADYLIEKLGGVLTHQPDVSEVPAPFPGGRDSRGTPSLA